MHREHDNYPLQRNIYDLESHYNYKRFPIVFHSINGDVLKSSFDCGANFGEMGKKRKKADA